MQQALGLWVVDVLLLVLGSTTHEGSYLYSVCRAMMQGRFRTLSCILGFMHATRSGDIPLASFLQCGVCSTRNTAIDGLAVISAAYRSNVRDLTCQPFYQHLEAWWIAHTFLRLALTVVSAAGIAWHGTACRAGL